MHGWFVLDCNLYPQPDTKHTSTRTCFSLLLDQEFAGPGPDQANPSLLLDQCQRCSSFRAPFCTKPSQSNDSLRRITQSTAIRHGLVGPRVLLQANQPQEPPHPHECANVRGVPPKSSNNRRKLYRLIEISILHGAYIYIYITYPQAPPVSCPSAGSSALTQVKSSEPQIPRPVETGRKPFTSETTMEDPGFRRIGPGWSPGMDSRG